MSKRLYSYVAAGCLAGLVLIVGGRAVAGLGGEALHAGPHPSGEPVERMEWDDPCADFLKDIENGMDGEDLSARYGLAEAAAVPGLGEIRGFGCMAGSDTGLEAIVVYRNAGDNLYSDYIIADGGPALDWVDWFTATQPDLEMRPIEHGWTSEPPGLSDGLPDQPVWGQLPEVLEELER